jgi:hypothetical protein
MSNIKIKIDKIASYLAKQAYSDALNVYADIHAEDKSFLYPDSIDTLSENRITHIRNAANLSRRALYEMLHGIPSSKRVSDAVEMLCGTMPKKFDKVQQQPNFFFVPNLPSSPFTDPKSIEGLEQFVETIAEFKSLLCNMTHRAHERYIDTVGGAPNTEQWNKLKENWTSVHLIKAGKLTDAGEQLPIACKKALASDLIAHCAPHAPEVVISVLQPHAVIPPHFGISNIKWTLHIPLVINENATLTVGGQTVAWNEQRNALLFDDSYEHSAKNESDMQRAVLIIDIWNPHLTLDERADIKRVMLEYNNWSSAFGVLANIDSRFYK